MTRALKRVRSAAAAARPVGDTTGRMLRPAAAVLTEHALLPPGNLIEPAPNQFTHELASSQPFFFTRPAQDRAPDGKLVAGARVVLLVHDGGAYCRVADEHGLYVEIEYLSLKRL